MILLISASSRFIGGTEALADIHSMKSIFGGIAWAERKFDGRLTVRDAVWLKNPPQSIAPDNI